MQFQQLEFIKHAVQTKRRVYLDHNATTKVSSMVRNTMNKVLKSSFGNPSSIYADGRRSSEIIEDARQYVANAINADSSEIYFTGCATESNNSVIISLTDHFFPEKNKIITTPIEHPSVMKTLDYLKMRGVIVEYCPVDCFGRVILAELERLIDDNTFLICCMLANNEIGTIQDIKSISSIAKKRDVLVLSDCVQAFGKIPIDVKNLDIDYATFSAHKLYGPKGIGALFVRQNSPFAPFIHGGHQEKGMRAGTESIHNIAGFGAACRVVDSLILKARNAAKLKLYFIEQLKLVKSDCIINSPISFCLPNTISATFPGINNAGLMVALDNFGIAVSAGSACSAQDETPSHVLKAVGLSDKAAKETIRISLGTETTLRDIKYTLNVLKKYVNGQIPSINMITPAQFDESLLFDEKKFILDVRPQILRKITKGIPGSHEISFVSIEKYISQLPKDKNIVVVCQSGNISIVVAYYLKSKGFNNVSNLLFGINGWKSKQCELYQKYAGKNIKVLLPN